MRGYVTESQGMSVSTQRNTILFLPEKIPTRKLVRKVLHIRFSEIFGGIRFKISVDQQHQDD